MLKGIPSILSPHLLKTLCEMGHGEEIVLADGNFPVATLGKRIVRCDGLNTAALLDAILTVFPLDTTTSKPVTLMEIATGDFIVPIIWDEYKKIINNYEDRNTIRCLEREQFLSAAEKAYAIVATSEKAAYSNIILRKGLVF